TAFPQLYFSELAALVSPSASVKNAANANVMEAIRKIKMRQLYNGGVMLWENESSEHWWTSVYAAHFLLEAKKAGFEVDPSLLNTLLDYLINQLKQKRIITYYYNRNLNKKIAPKEVAYSLYVLALAGRTQAATMNYYKANSELLSLDSRYILAAAYAMAGDKNKFREILPSSFSGEVSVQQTGGSFYSEVRDEAIALNVLLDVDPGNAQVPVMAKHISENLKSKRYLNTQERVFSFLALGKLAKAAASSDITADIRVNSKSVARFQSAEVSLGMKELGGSSVELVTSGNGTLYYSWVAEGISVSGAYTEEDSYLKVRRQFFDRFGKPLNGNSFRQNDLIVVGITLEKSVSGAVENIVLSDIIPAGFEIENSRLRDLPGMDWIKGESQPVALDIRDDRINIFVDLTQNRQTYYYSVRAVSPGVYRMGPVSADAMYKGEYHSYHGGGIVKILP
ncbi:MAG TPA: hypothetical protein VIK74_08810, partial [Parasegetibacter sp.]